MGAHNYVAHSDQSQLDAIAGSLDFILVTLATQEPVDFSKFFPLLRPRGTLCFVGMCPPITADVRRAGTPTPPTSADPPLASPGQQPPSASRPALGRPARGGTGLHAGLHDGQDHHLQHGRAQGDGRDAQVLRREGHRRHARVARAVAARASGGFLRLGPCLGASAPCSGCARLAGRAPWGPRGGPVPSGEAQTAPPLPRRRQRDHAADGRRQRVPRGARDGQGGGALRADQPAAARAVARGVGGAARAGAARRGGEVGWSGQQRGLRRFAADGDKGGFGCASARYIVYWFHGTMVQLFFAAVSVIEVGR